MAVASDHSNTPSSAPPVSFSLHYAGRNCGLTRKKPTLGDSEDADASWLYNECTVGGEHVSWWHFTLAHVGLDLEEVGPIRHGRRRQGIDGRHGTGA